MATGVWLRPITDTHLDLIEMLYEDPAEAGEYGFYGYQNPGILRRRFAGEGLLSDRGGRLAVVAGEPGTTGTLAGEVSWHQVQTGPTSACWNIGIGLLERARGRGYGAQAQRQVAAYLFAHTQLNRVEAQTETGNLAEQRSWRRPDSQGRAFCGAPSSATASGATWCPTRCSGATWQPAERPGQPSPPLTPGRPRTAPPRPRPAKTSSRSAAQ